MAVKISGGGGEGYTPIEKGTYPGVIDFCVMVGTHDHTFNGETKKRLQVILGYELPIEKEDKDGKKYNAQVKQFYTASTDDRSKLYPVIKAALGRDLSPEEKEEFELDTLVGKTVAVTIDHKKKSNGEIGDYVSGVSPLMKGIPPMKMSREPVIFDFSMVKADGTLDIPEGVPEGIKTKLIYESDEYKEMVSKSFDSTPVEQPSVEDDIPMDYDTVAKDEAEAEAEVDEAEAEEDNVESTLEEKIAALEASLPDSIPPEVRANLIENLKKMEG
jgi:hypothetical protein